MPPTRDKGGAALIKKQPVEIGKTNSQISQETILQEAQRLVYGDRQADYGHPADDYGRAAAMWTVVLGHPVTAKQAALCMCCVKISREVNKPKRDNMVDLAGYAAVAQRIQNREDGTE